jgi:ribosomal protein S18 acetylase RimI-like enzyme
MNDFKPAVEIGPARPNEMAAVFRLLFRHLDKEDRETRVVNALKMLRDKELSASGAIVARTKGQLRGALFCQPAAGAGGLIWPPQTQPKPSHETEDLLICQACRHLADQGGKLIQSLLAVEEANLGESLERNGFKHTTQLWYMKHELDFSRQFFQSKEQLTYQSYADCDRSLFHQTLLGTYEGTLDCPEVNGVRQIEEIIAGHKNQGRHNPNNWWIASDREKPVGVLMLAEMPDINSWELLYLGVAAKSRGHGYGSELTRKALWEARALEAPQLTLSVDVRNQPALSLYKNLGFKAYDQREVFLKILK